MNKFRTEEDLLGQISIDNNNLYGIHTKRALNNFNISTKAIGDDAFFIKALLTTKKASAMANAKFKLIDPRKSDAIIKACDKLLELDDYKDLFPIDQYQGGAGTSTNMNTNEVIANCALAILGNEYGEYEVISPNDDVNKSQSTNDAYPTAFRLALINKTNQVLVSLKGLVDVLYIKSSEFNQILKMGRTQLQDAVPMTLGQEFKAFAVTLKEELKTIRMCQELLFEINLGATAIGTGINTPSGYSDVVIDILSQITGHKFTPAEDLVEATSDCGAYVMLSSAYKRLGLKLSKICNDLRLLSSGPRAGLKEINLPEMQAGSSIMPAKVNPVIPEVVNQIAFKVCGNDLTICMASEAGQLQLNVMEPVIAESLFEIINLLDAGINTLNTKCIQGITANKQRCERFVYDSIGIITYLNPYIGHHKGDEVGKICAQTGKCVKEVVLELKLLTSDELDNILCFENFISDSKK